MMSRPTGRITREGHRKRWKVLVGKRTHLWGRYGSELEAWSAARKLRRHGFRAIVQQQP